MATKPFDGVKMGKTKSRDYKIGNKKLNKKLKNIKMFEEAWGDYPSTEKDESKIESSPSDDLKSNFRSWEADHDNEDDANGLFSILMDRHPKENEAKMRQLAFDWVGYEEEHEPEDPEEKHWKANTTWQERNAEENRDGQDD